jgi:hypothetical protein
MMLRNWGRRGLTLLMLAALWLPSVDAVLHGALSPHQWVRHVESADGCHAERCLLGMALAERAIVAAPAVSPPIRSIEAFAEPTLPADVPLPVRHRPSSLPRSPPA